MDAKDVGDLIQISIEDDVDDITAAEGTADKSYLQIIKDGQVFKIVVLHTGDVDSVSEDDDEFIDAFDDEDPPLNATDNPF